MTHASTFCTEVFSRLWDPFYLASFIGSYNLVPTSKAKEKHPGDEVEVATTSCKNIWDSVTYLGLSGVCMILRLRSPFPPSPLGKVAGNALPCPILGGTTLNGGEEEGKSGGVRTTIAMHYGFKIFKMAAKVEKFRRLYALFFNRYSAFLRSFCLMLKESYKNKQLEVKTTL